MGSHVCQFFVTCCVNVFSIVVWFVMFVLCVCQCSATLFLQTCLCVFLFKMCFCLFAASRNVFEAPVYFTPLPVNASLCAVPCVFVDECNIYLNVSVNTSLWVRRATVFGRACIVRVSVFRRQEHGHMRCETSWFRCKCNVSTRRLCECRGNCTWRSSHSIMFEVVGGLDFETLRTTMAGLEASLGYLQVVPAQHTGLQG